MGNKNISQKQKKGISTDIPERTGSLLFSQLPTIFAVMMLNFCVRYGYRCVHHAITTRSLLNAAHSKLNSNLIYLNSLSLG